MADKSYVVKGLMAIANLDNGQAVHLQHGAPLPSNVDPSHLAHLLSQGLVEEGEVAGGLAPVLSGDGQTVITSPNGDQDDVDVDDDPDGPGPMPAKSASRADWDDYAATQGLTPEEVAAFSSKEDLQKHFGVS